MYQPQAQVQIFYYISRAVNYPCRVSSQVFRHWVSTHPVLIMISWILSLVCLVSLLGISLPANAVSEAETPTITEEQLQEAESIAQKAFEAAHQGDLPKSEQYWSQLIEQFPTNPAVWSNRGNIRISENKLDEAIEDFNQAIELAPNAPDPYLNRGTALEGKGLYQEAIEDYDRVLEIDPEDPMAYNNRGNAKAGQQLWDEALIDYQKAVEIDSNYAFARANAALTQYQIGDTDEAIKSMKDIVHRYPMFPDMRAALTAALWEKGKQGEAESNWVAAVGVDNRYQDIKWVEQTRRWPPKMVAALEKFLDLD